MLPAERISRDIPEAAFSFAGNKLDILATAADTKGTFSITIDNQPAVTVDCADFAGEYGLQKTVFESEILSAGQHTAEITVESGEIDFDAVRVYKNAIDIPLLRVQEFDEHLLYSDGWTNRVQIGKFYNHIAKQASKKNESMSFTFVGNYFNIISYKSYSQGIFDVYVDDEKIDSVDLYVTGADTNFKEKVAETFLPYGEHTVLIKIAGKNAKSVGYSMYIDAVEIRGEFVPIVNTATGSLTVTKDIAGDLSNSDFSAGDFAFTVTNGTDTYTVQLPTANGEWSQTLTDIPVGDYTVTETSAVSKPGYNVSTSGEGSVTVSQNATATKTVTNTYTEATETIEILEPDIVYSDVYDAVYHRYGTAVKLDSLPELPDGARIVRAECGMHVWNQSSSAFLLEAYHVTAYWDENYPIMSSIASQPEDSWEIDPNINSAQAPLPCGFPELGQSPLSCPLRANPF